MVLCLFKKKTLEKTKENRKEPQRKPTKLVQERELEKPIIIRANGLAQERVARGGATLGV
jgi:hypothetical protein